MLSRHALIVAVLLLARSPAPVLAQCTPQWNTSLGAQPGIGMNSWVEGLHVYDDGGGPELYAIGSFTQITGGIAAAHIARWDGASWSALGAGLDGIANAMCTYDDGTGPALYVVGSFTSAGGLPASRIARWDGTSWSALGSGLSDAGLSLAVYDNGLGAKLYVGGYFTLAGGQTAKRIAVWDGTSWSPLIDNLGVNGLTSTVYSLGVYDEGSGSRLYVGVGQSLRRWDGMSWSSVPAFSGGAVKALVNWDDGSGPSLVAAGEFTFPAKRIARLQGSTWYPFGTGFTSTNSSVRSVCGFDDGSGPALFAAGYFFQVGGIQAAYLARWQNGAWSAVGNGIDNEAHALQSIGSGASAALYVGGLFEVADAAVATTRIARWQNGSFSTLGVPNAIAGVNGTVIDGLVHDDGSGPALYLAGTFSVAGASVSPGIARWNGSTWSGLGPGSGPRPKILKALVDHDDGSGTRIYACGRFDGTANPNVDLVCFWNGTLWTTVGTTDGNLLALLSHDDGSGPALYAAGHFTQVDGVPAKNVARWNGTSWSALGAGLDSDVLELVAFDAGAGARVTAGGYFQNSGTTFIGGVAQWDGSAWTQLGINAPEAEVLFAGDIGAGMQLFMGSAQGPPRVLSGGSWNFIGGFPGAYVYSFGLFDDGGGTKLVAGGSDAIASWNGSSWSQLGTGVAGSVMTLTVYDGLPGGGPDLYVGGFLLYAGGSPVSMLALWEGCLANVTSICPGDGSLAPCPCANPGAGGNGCENSIATGGSRLDAHGTVNPDTMLISVVGELPTALSIFLQGTAHAPPVAFGDGLRCVSGALKRLYVKNAVGGAVAAPQGADLSISARSALLGDTLAPGALRYYQTYYRDANAGFCPAPQGNTWNVSNGVRIRW